MTWARVGVQIGKQYRQAQHVLSYMQAWQSTCLQQGDFSNDCSIATFRSASLQRWGAETLRTASSSEEVQPPLSSPPSPSPSPTWFLPPHSAATCVSRYTCRMLHDCTRVCAMA